MARYLGLGAAEVVVKNAGGPVRFGAADGAHGEVTGLPRTAPVDSTAAGDSFNAGYPAARLEGAGRDAAIRAGHALGRAVIGHRGALVPAAVAAVRPGGGAAAASAAPGAGIGRSPRRQDGPRRQGG